MNVRHLALLCAASLAVTACGGTKLVRNAPPVPVREAPLAVASDAQLAAALDFVIVRNGPGAWAKNGDWDEYLLQLRNESATPLTIDAISVTDSSGHVATALADRKQLVKASKQASKRYRQAGIKVLAGRGGAGLVASGIGAGIAGYGAAVGSMSGALLGGAGAGSGATAAAGGLILAAPVLIGVGIVRAVNNSKVNGGIEQRTTRLPYTLDPQGTLQLDLFYPISPSPQRVTIRYHAAAGAHSLDIDTRQALAGLHLPAAPAKVVDAAK